MMFAAGVVTGIALSAIMFQVFVRELRTWMA